MPACWHAAGEDGDAGEAAVQDAIRTLAQQALATGSCGLGSLPNGDTYRSGVEIEFQNAEAQCWLGLQQATTTGGPR